MRPPDGRRFFCDMTRFSPDLICRTNDRWLLANLIDFFDLVGNGIARYVEELATTCVMNPEFMVQTTRVFSKVQVITPFLIGKVLQDPVGVLCEPGLYVKLFLFTVLTAVRTINMKHYIYPLVSDTSCTMLVDKGASVESEHRERFGQWVHLTWRARPQTHVQNPELP